MDNSSHSIMQNCGYATGLGFAVVICVLAFVFIRLFKGSGGRIMDDLYRDYTALAPVIGAEPPARTSGKRKSYPELAVVTGPGTITVTPDVCRNLDIQYDDEDILRMDPYTSGDVSGRVRTAVAARTLQSVMGAFGVGGSRRNTPKPITRVTLSMHARLKGSRILITPETLIGKGLDMGEIKIEHPGFESGFKVHGVDEAAVLQFLSPKVCDAMLNFRKNHGRFQVSEDRLMWVQSGFDTAKIPAVVNGLRELAEVLNG